MKSILSGISLVFAMIAALSAGIFAQNRTPAAAASDKYVISAKPGGVNFVEGTVAIARKNGQSGRLLKGDQVEIGDRISTGADGRAEILLNPGSYVRLGGDASFQFKTTSLENLQLRLDRGSAILEVFAADEFTVTLHAPKAKFRLINSGVFRLDVLPDGAGTLSVWKGRALVGTSGAGLIKPGRAMTVSNSLVTLAKFDRDKQDELDMWSKARGKQLAKLTDSLQKREMRNILLNSYAGNQWNVYNSFGLWVFDRFSGSYCFLPFGYGWSSPYGYGFGHSLSRYDLPWYVYSQPTWTPSPGQTSGQTPGQAPAPTITPIVTAGDRRAVPPFIRMSGNSGRGDIGNDTQDPGNDYRPTYPIRQAPAPSAPPPTKMDSPPMTLPTSDKDGN